MTKEELMYVTGIEDKEQLENLMLLGGDPEPEDGNYIEVMRRWYDGMCGYTKKLEQKATK